MLTLPTYGTEKAGSFLATHPNLSREYKPMTVQMRLAPWDQSDSVSCVVAIPIHNERSRIVGCLKALADQIDVPGAGLGILLFLNNCNDGTRHVIEEWAPKSPWPISILECDSASASAGWARHHAMQAGAVWLERVGQTEGILLTTDADTIVPITWVCNNAAAIAAGADAVAGHTTFDPGEAALLCVALRNRQQIESEYEYLLAEIEARLDPRPGNPWPCHRTKSGASIAVRLAAFRHVGGMPPLPSGEDHAFIDRIVACGLVARHAPDIVVTTSSRLEGRAQGGTADTLKSWSENLDSPCDPRVERVGVFVVRILRRTLRRRLRLPDPKRRRQSVLRRPLRPHELPRQIRRARLFLKLIRPLGARRADILSFAPCLLGETPEPLLRS